MNDWSLIEEIVDMNLTIFTGRRQKEKLIYIINISITYLS